MMYVTKTLTGFSTAHRLWTADSHCRFVHGYERSFDLTLGAEHLDENGWVFDFGQFKSVKAMLEAEYDHTLHIANDDPYLKDFLELDRAGVVDLRVREHPGMEGAAAWIMEHIGEWFWTATAGRVALVEVTARENDRNAVTIKNPFPSPVSVPC